MGLKSIEEKAKSTYSIIILVILSGGGTFYYTKNEVISIIVGALVIFALAIWDLHERLAKLEIKQGARDEKPTEK